MTARAIGRTPSLTLAGTRLAAILCVSSEIASAAPSAPSFLQTCIISAPTPAPLLPSGFLQMRRKARDSTAEDSKSAEASDDDDEDDEVGLPPFGGPLVI